MVGCLYWSRRRRIERREGGRGSSEGVVILSNSSFIFEMMSGSEAKRISQEETAIMRKP